MKKIYFILFIFFISFSLIYFSGCKKEDPIEEDPIENPDEEDYTDRLISLEQAIILAGTDPEAVTIEKYYVQGVITAITNSSWGNMTISDGTTNLVIYGMYNKDGSTLYGDMEEKPRIGDQVILYGVLGYYNSAEMKNAWLMKWTAAIINPDINLDDYEVCTIQQSREKETGSKVLIEGVVAATTYANGMKPNGIYLIDATNSIYIYSEEIAGAVEVGNQIEVAGERTNYILADELENADKHGYQGSIQLDSAVLVANDRQINTYHSDWIASTSIKEIIDTPLTDNITTTIFEVNALIEKSPQAGYTNYYFRDIDGVTGSYVYTSNNGADFTWLDPYDGKICRIYLSVINGKSSVASFNYRFYPIKILSDEFSFDVDDAAEYAVLYHGVDQFLNTYENDPALELTTVVNSSLLGVEGISLGYQSDNQDIIYFEEEEGKTIMHTLNQGTATITITGFYLEIEYTTQVEITVLTAAEMEFITVQEAIASADETTVRVRGIVGASLVNQSGFYLIDATGVIAVKCDATELQGLNLGNDVIVEGNRVHYNQTATAIGQSCLLDSTILVNYYGNHPYSVSSFDQTDKTVTDLVNYSTLDDYSTTVFVIEATVYLYQSTYSSMYELMDDDGTTYLALYSSSAGQYAFLSEFVGKKVVVEVALCNWNKKTEYKGCVLRVIDDEIIAVNDYNFK